MANKPLKDFICHGGFEVPEPVRLRAGVLSLYYSKASLRYIRAGRIEILRMIYPAVRDKNWLTAEPDVLEEKITDKGSSFSVSIKCRYKSGDIDFLSEYFIEGKEDNSITLTMKGEALNFFEKNRIGFCILHPVDDCMGKYCVVFHPNGATSRKLFPIEISPHQVFSDIRAMNWPAAHGLCSLSFSGDVFETEDQRNWTDASFKTYSTPLSVPYPVKIEKGTIINQSVTFRAENIRAEKIADDDITCIDICHEESKRLPDLGIGRATGRPHLTEAETEILRPLRFDHYRIDIHLFAEGWESSADEAVRESEMLSYKCELALFFSENFGKEAEYLIDWLKKKEINISCVLVYHKNYPSTPFKLARHVIPLLIEKFPGIRTGTGTNANFAQLNRNRPGDDYATITTFSIHPQEHASDNLTLVENLAAQEWAAKSALGFAGERSIRVSPVNIQRRFNANQANIKESTDGIVCPTDVDARMMSLFGGCWTAISLKYLCSSDISGITYFETSGERGIIQGEYDSRWPEEFPAKKGMLFPVYFLFKYILKYKNLRIIKSISSNPLISDALVLSDGKQARIMVVNFTGKEQKVAVTGCTGTMKLTTFDYERYIDAFMNRNWDPENDRSRHPADRPFLLRPWSVTFAEVRMKQQTLNLRFNTVDRICNKPGIPNHVKSVSIIQT